MKCKFELANLTDAKAIAAIESEYFAEGIAYTEEFIKDWMLYNPEMFYVVRDETGTVMAHTILVPVTKECYECLHQNLIHDMLEFQKKDVLQTKQSNYYYTASIAIHKDAIKKLSVSSELLSGIICYFYEYGHRIITTPITKAGLSITKSLGYNAINGVDSLNNNYEIIIGVEKDDPLRKKYEKIIKRKKK